MLDTLELALSLYNFTYVRLDGSTKTEKRQPLVELFNSNPKIFCFISSTRSGGIGLNLTSADTVIFYDSDWNPAIDKQAQVSTHLLTFHPNSAKKNIDFFRTDAIESDKLETLQSTDWSLNTQLKRIFCWKICRRVNSIVMSWKRVNSIKQLSKNKQ